MQKKKKSMVSLPTIWQVKHKVKLEILQKRQIAISSLFFPKEFSQTQ